MVSVAVIGVTEFWLDAVNPLPDPQGWSGTHISSRGYRYGIWDNMYIETGNN
jgi:hypothetical protein